MQGGKTRGWSHSVEIVQLNQFYQSLYQEIKFYMPFCISDFASTRVFSKRWTGRKEPFTINGNSKQEKGENIRNIRILL